MQIRLALAVLVSFVAPAAMAQEEGVLQLGDDLHVYLERQQAAGRLPGIFLDVRPLSAADVDRALDTLSARESELDRIDRYLLARYRGEAPAPGAEFARRYIPAFYRDGEHLASAEGDGFRLVFEPLGYLARGSASRTGLDPDGPSVTWQNTRGIRGAGRIGDRFFFETRLEENQRQPIINQHVVSTAPRLGDVKLQGGDTYDYWRATGVLGYRDRFVEVRLGHDRNRWGFGMNSLGLSDYSPAYDQLQVRARVWRLQYVSLFMRRTDPRVPGAGATRFPSSYGALHQLSVDLPVGFQASIFESVVFADDSLGSRGFELAYLNPITHGRAGQRGAPSVHQA